MKPAFGQPTRLGNVLNRLVRQKGIAEQSSQQALQELWKTSVDQRIADKTFVRKFRAGILEIGVSNGAILEELNSYLRHDLLIAVQKKHPDPKIESLKFVKV